MTGFGKAALRSSFKALIEPKRIAFDAAAAAACPLRPAPLACVRVVEVAELVAMIRQARLVGLPMVCFGSGSRLRSRRKLAEGAYLALSLTELTGVEELQDDGLWLRARSGTPLSEIVSRAARAGLRPLGFDADSRGSLGGWLAGNARMPDPILGLWQPACLGIEAVLPDGTLVASRPSPRAATGSDWFSLMLGTNGAFGAITAATIKLEPLPERRLVIGFRFRNVAPALGLLRQLLQRGWPPSEASLLMEGGPRKKVRLWLRYEGQARLAAQATRWCQQQAALRHAKVAALDQVREWQAETPSAGTRVLQAPVRYGQVNDLLAKVSSWQEGFRAILDRVDATGGRLRIELERRVDAKTRKDWGEAWDPDALMRKRVDAAHARLRSVAMELDPDGLFNPHAWPLAWPGGGA